jgi:signal transduction histidine kinase
MDSDPEFNSRLIDNAITSVELMKNTLDSLTTIIKQRKAFQRRYKDRNIEPVFNNVILSNTIDQKKQITIRSDFSECTTFSMSDIHLNTVLQNIISNAVSTLQIIQRLPNL